MQAVLQDGKITLTIEPGDELGPLEYYAGEPITVEGNVTEEEMQKIRKVLGANSLCSRSESKSRVF